MQTQAPGVGSLQSPLTFFCYSSLIMNAIKNIQAVRGQWRRK